MSTIITKKEAQRQRSRAIFHGSPWRVLGWFGFMMTLIGIGQLILYLYPAMAFGSPEWEYGASAQLLGALPFPTIGLAALFAAAAGSGSRRGLLSLFVLLLLMTLSVFAVFALFWSVVPMALRATPAAMREPVYQTIGRATLSGVGFGIMYLWAAGLAVRQLKRTSERSPNA
ncbi:MAG TPA: hypothetical protein VGD27_18315 [Longimicrobiales bacterium]